MPRSYPPEFRRKVLDLVGTVLPVHLASRVLCVSDSGHYRWRVRPVSTCSLRQLFLTELISAVHTASPAACTARADTRRAHARV